MAWVAVGTTAVSTAGQIFGAIKGGKAMKEQQTQIDRDRQENKSMFDETANKDFLETSAAKGAMKLNNENLQDAQKNVAGRSAITGASDEANVASQTGLNRNYNDAVSRLAGMGTQYQERAKDRYSYNKNLISQRQSNLTAQKAEAAANVASNAGNLMGTAAMSLGGNSKGAGSISPSIPKLAETPYTKPGLANITPDHFTKLYGNG